MTALLQGMVFAERFTVLQKIGTGGMGAVYEVEQLSTRKRRALKVMTTRIGGDEKAQARFVREATVGAKIESEHIVDVIAAGIDLATGVPWLAMELLDGCDLRQLVDVRGVLGPAAVRQIFQELGHGLAAAHDVGVIHRDLKPENIFVARSHRVQSPFTTKILDFGIAKIATESVFTTDTATIGSPMWMAPEQINAEALSTRTDIWALGLLAFWALTGRVYWKAAYGTRVTVQALFAEQLFAPLEAASVRAQHYGCREQVVGDFDAWFAACVARDPLERFADARAASFALAEVLREAAEHDDKRDVALLPSSSSSWDKAVSGPAVAPDLPGAMDHSMAGTTAGMLASDSPTLGPAPLVEPPSETMGGTTSEPGGTTSEPSDTGEGVTSRDTATGEPVSADAVAASPVPAAKSGLMLALALSIPVVLAGGTAGYLMLRGPSPTPIESNDEMVDLGVQGEARGGLDLPPRPDVPSATPLSRVRADQVLPTLPVPVGSTFEGWSSDGEYFVVRATFGDSDGSAPGLELLLVHDHNGQLRQSYISSSSGVAQEDPFAVAAASAETLEAWSAVQKRLRLRPPDPRRAHARRTGAFQLDIEVPQGTRVSTRPKRTGFELRWFDFAGLSGTQTRTRPRLRLAWVEDGARRQVLHSELHADADALQRTATSGEPSFGGTLRAYWSPDGERALVMLNLVGSTTTVADHRWFLVEVPRR